MPDTAVSAYGLLVRPFSALAQTGRADISDLRALTGLLVGSIVLLLVVGVVGSMLLRRSWWGLQRGPARSQSGRSGPKARVLPDAWAESAKRLRVKPSETGGEGGPVDLDGPGNDDDRFLGDTPPEPMGFEPGPDDDPQMPPGGPPPKPPGPSDRGPRGTGGGGGKSGWRPTKPKGPAS